MDKQIPVFQRQAQLTESARAVLRMISRVGPMSRPQLSSALAFSKPTMSAAVGELQELGLVATDGIAQGAIGRSAITYGLGINAGIVIGVDCGTTQVHAMATLLDGKCLAEQRQQIDGTSTRDLDLDRFRAIEETIKALLGELDGQASTLRIIAIALPNTISRSLARVAARTKFLQTLRRIYKRYNVPILVENNVNCAALAEFHLGAARNRSLALYMQIGVKIGVGIVINGNLFRGFRGGAGEVGHLPFPWSETETPRWQQGETYLGSLELLKRCQAIWPEDGGPPPTSTEELFSKAETVASARECIEAHARNIGNLASACVSIIDPEVIVLGGGVGQNPVLLPGVKRVVDELCWPVEIVVSELSRQATVLGAVKLAIDVGLGDLLGEGNNAALLYPTDFLAMT